MKRSIEDADWEFIVRAVNAHDELVRYLTDYLNDDRCVCDEAQLKQGTCRACLTEAALAKATQ